MNEFLKISADDAFSYCASRGWDERAWSFWRAHERATRERRALRLLGCVDPSVDVSYRISASVFDSYCEQQGWNGEKRYAFEKKLYERQV